MFVSKTTHRVRKDAEPLITAHEDLCFKSSSQGFVQFVSFEFIDVWLVEVCVWYFGGTVSLTSFGSFVLVDFANELGIALRLRAPSFFRCSASCICFRVAIVATVADAFFVLLLATTAACCFFRVEALTNFHCIGPLCVSPSRAFGSASFSAGSVFRPPS